MLGGRAVGAQIRAALTLSLTVRQHSAQLLSPVSHEELLTRSDGACG